ncbi:hypothetical protein XENOCAPTIV_011863 [Xenoophorus captivus]|uniref:Uncharacterized protein n=1 Tax=Xenoophorus captivus TaxID=1517983 RepID=A0ABV0SFP2_9TELE
MMWERSSVRLTIRKIQFSPENTEVAPFADMTFEFLMSEKPLHVKLSLPKEVRVGLVLRSVNVRQIIHGVG